MSRDTHRRQETPVHAPDEKYRLQTTHGRKRGTHAPPRRALANVHGRAAARRTAHTRPIVGQSARPMCPCVALCRALVVGSGESQKSEAGVQFSSVQSVVYVVTELN